ncbi:hypothetical protein [[Clostridium] colinum]|uniref:hypothetical protein n=1 Tax=[Clostridium] colinum TaxID=36835 RepID=UPI0020252CE6|nr:hypothetical protein [[Clostridium] colinum]
MSKFIELKSKNFKKVNVDSIKMIEQVRDYTRLRYIFTDDSEFVEVFETEEELQNRITVLKVVLMGVTEIHLNVKPIKKIEMDEIFAIASGRSCEVSGLYN